MTVTVDGVEYPAMTIFHPSYLLRNNSMEEGSPRRLMQQDLAEIKNKFLNNKSENFFENKEMAMV